MLWNKYRMLRISLAVPLLLFALLVLVKPSHTVQRTSTSKPCYSQFGVSLSGAEWDDPQYRPTLDELKYYSAKGVRIIRLPLRWGRLQPTLNGPLNVDEVSWLESFIGQANSWHITVDIDLHLRTQTDDLNFGPKLPPESLVDLWGKLAAALHNIPGICGYDIANEPDHEPGYQGRWPARANAVINAIRKVDGNHYIFVGEDNWDSSSLWNAKEAEQIKDPVNRLVYEAHSYWDDDKSGNYAPNSPPKSEVDAKELVTTNLAPFVNWCGSHRRCFVGEFGTPPERGWLLALEDALQYMRQNNIAGAYWAGGPGWGKDYPLSIEPHADGTDSPQMRVLEKYLAA